MNKCCCNYPAPLPIGSKGDDGKNGLTPFIGENGDWFIGTTDTGVIAAGTDGTDGVTPHIGNNGNWFIGVVDTGVHAQGEQGIPGKDGKDGVNGINGTNGTAATVTVGTTTTLPAGSLATVNNTGTSTAAILNFGIPQGIPGGSGNVIFTYASFFGVLLNDADLPTTVPSGGKIPWKILNNNEEELITSPTATPYFQFTKTGRYMCTFSLRCFAKVSGDNAVVNWGIYAASIQKAMVASASAFVTPNMTDISGVGIFDVVNTNEQYNFINNSKVPIQVQGAASTQIVNTAFVGVTGLNVVDGLSCVFIRLGDVREQPLSKIKSTKK